MSIEIPDKAAKLAKLSRLFQEAERAEDHMDFLYREIRRRQANGWSLTRELFDRNQAVCMMALESHLRFRKFADSLEKEISNAKRRTASRQ